MNTYSVQESNYLGNPVLEVLVTGRAWGDVYPGDAHFRFGCRKAAMIMTACDLIEVFARTGGKRPRHDHKLLISDPGLCCTSECTVYSGFTTSFGQTVNQPYMKLVEPLASIGFGVQKAVALTTLHHAIREFVLSHYATQSAGENSLDW